MREGVRESGTDRSEGGSDKPGPWRSYDGGASRPPYHRVSRGGDASTRREDRAREMRWSSEEMSSGAEVRAAPGGVHDRSARNRPELAAYAATRWPKIDLSNHKNLSRVTSFQLPRQFPYERWRLSHRNRAAALLQRGYDAMPPTNQSNSGETPPTLESGWTGTQCRRRERGQQSRLQPDSVAPSLSRHTGEDARTGHLQTPLPTKLQNCP
ncbi:hypothetical protein VNO77_03396 [Canavalia gladiata]|uniref:Uncharacterized protein n=1 Tax=Canavalia gladiata TaxID=3824 RepID=A0AAN9N0A7_CANGL